MVNNTDSLLHIKWLRKYHFVIVPKYRRKVIYNKQRENLREIIRALRKYRGAEIIEWHMMPYRVHLLLSISSSISISSFIGYLRDRSSLMMFDKYANLKYKFDNQHFWTKILCLKSKPK